MKLFAAVGNIECSKVETFLVPTRIAFAKEALGRGHMPVVQAIAFGLYGFFVNINKFNKAMAMMLFTLFGLSLLATSAYSSAPGMPFPALL